MPDGGLPASAPSLDEVAGSCPDWVQSLAAPVFFCATGVVAFTVAAVLFWIVGIHGERRDLALFITAALVLPVLCAALQVFVIRPNYRSERAGLFETASCLAAIALLLALSSVPIAIYAIGGDREALRRGIEIFFLTFPAWLGSALAFRPWREGLRVPEPLRSRGAHVAIFVSIIFLAGVLAFRIDQREPYLTFLVRLFVEPPFDGSPAPFGLARALLVAFSAIGFVGLLWKWEASLIRSGSTWLVKVRRVALIVTVLLTVLFFFDFSLNVDPLHYLTNVAPAVQVLHGGTPLVDSFSQYGSGPVLLTALAFLIGPITFGTAQVAVQCANFTHYSLWLVCLYRMCRWKLPGLFLGFCSIAMLLAAWAHGYGNVNDNPSQGGLRYLPTLLMVSALSTLRPPGRHSAFTAASTFVAGLWSVETLIATLGVHAAFLGLLGIRDRAFRRLALDGVTALVPAVAAIGVTVLATVWWAGVPPDYTTYLGFLSSYNMLSSSWAIVATPRFYGWMAMAVAIFLVAGDAWVRVFNPRERVTALDDECLYYRFVPMAMLLVVQAAYFVARSVDYTLLFGLLAFCAIAIPAAFGFMQLTFAARGPVRLLGLLPVAMAIWVLTFIPLSLFRQHHTVLERDCPNPFQCTSAPYSLLLHECRDHGRCSPATVLGKLLNRIHERSVLEQVWTARIDYWYDRLGIARDAVAMINRWAANERGVTVLVNGTSPADFIAAEVALMYTGTWHRWPRGFGFSDELVPSLVEKIVAAPVHLRENELIVVRRDETVLRVLDKKILQRIRSGYTLCELPYPSAQVVAYRVGGPGACPTE